MAGWLLPYRFKFNLLDGLDPGLFSTFFSKLSPFSRCICSISLMLLFELLVLIKIDLTDSLSAFLGVMVIDSLCGTHCVPDSRRFEADMRWLRESRELSRFWLWLGPTARSDSPAPAPKLLSKLLSLAVFCTYSLRLSQLVSEWLEFVADIEVCAPPGLRPL